jgi:hypothetical protein
MIRFFLIQALIDLTTLDQLLSQLRKEVHCAVHQPSKRKSKQRNTYQAE